MRCSFKKMELHPMVLQNSKSDTAIIMMGNKLQDAEARVLLKKHKKWLADGSTKLWKIKRWQKDPQNLHLRLLHTAETGPIYLDCKDFHRFFRQK
jgi:ribosomal protein L22